jgi:hypothetical protein
MAASLREGRRGRSRNRRRRKLAIDFLRDDSQARVAFIDKVAPPVANKLFECRMIS